ncbi:MAG: patatin-like protein, partial [Actinomycetota bacterium]|nr:patatin-like protein [Actinomycetota bacterium]
MTRPRFEPEQEVRFAIVMYGGVSLAIYINGVAQELFRLVRATAPEKPYPEAPHADQRVYFADEGSGGDRPELTGSERLYRELGQWLGIDGATEPVARDDEPAPVRTRFVVDIISGTSAGGINGVFLAKALAQQEEFGVSADMWLQVADIEELLRGEASWEGIAARPPREPESLLNGYRLYAKAREALAKMEQRKEIPQDPFRPSYAEQLELDVTATDLAGLPQPIRLAEGHRVWERVHRKVLRFEYGTEATTGEEHTDFAGNDLMLGFAARATSSFPFAFEPVRLRDVEPLFARFAEADPGFWFPGYPHPADAFFADGGYLDNKPFSYATQALRRRRADLPVARKLVYIEPDPAPDGPPAPTRSQRPDVYQNVADAMVGLPRFEPIRQDIADVAARNGAVARLRDIELDAEQALEEDSTAALQGPAYAAYRTLRARTVLDALAELAALLCGWASDDERAGTVREALRQWHGAQPAFALSEVDAAFQQRRLSFLQHRANDLLLGDERAPRMLAVAVKLGIDAAPQPSGPADEVLQAAAPPPLSADAAAALAAQRGGLRELKLRLNTAFDPLRRVERAPLSR